MATKATAAIASAAAAAAAGVGMAVEASAPAPAALASAPRAGLPVPAADARVAVRIEVEGGTGPAAEATLRRALAPLGGELRGRLRLGGPAFLAELPADAVGRLRRAPGVRRVAVVPDARTDLPPAR
jgi:hypothetical protein